MGSKKELQCLAAGTSRHTLLSVGCIEAKLRCLVGEATAWPGWTVSSGTLGLLPE
jgi:hypothetical protein